MILNKHVQNHDIENIYDSSHILASKYNTISQKLAIIFKNGTQYLYHDVKMTDYELFEGSDSQGKVINSTIKNYKTEKVDGKIDVTPILEQIQTFKSNM
mgnify:CR=1 FL=1